MERLWDKAAIAAICLVALGMCSGFYAPIAAFLGAAAASSAAQLLEGKRTGQAVIAIWAASCAVLPEMLLTLPLMVCVALREKKWWLLIPAAFGAAKAESIPAASLAVAGAGVLAAVIVSLRMMELETAVQNITSMRDQGTERNIQLAEQNKKLIQAQDDAVRLATLRERNRIAREIHDNVGHMLTRSLLQAGALGIVNKDEMLKEPIESLRSTLDSAMTSIRESVHDLHDDSIDLRMVIEESAGAVDDRFTVDIDYDCGDAIPGSVKLCIAGVVKEGFSNAVKHSDGDRINLVIREHPGFWQLMMEDNGHPKTIENTGIGLSNMEERARSVGGNISFTPSERGFRIFMTIPRERNRDEDSSN